MNKYIAILKSRRVEIEAPSLYAAKLQAVEELKPSKKDLGLLSVTLARTPEGPITHDPASL